MVTILAVLSFMVYWLLISLIAVPVVNIMFGNSLFHNFWFKYFFNLFIIIVLTHFGLI